MTIGSKAFNGRETKTLLGFHYVYRDSEEKVIVPDGMTSINGGLFARMSGLATVEIPDGVTSIGMGAFRECGFESIDLPDNLISIGDEAFYGSDLTSIEIPDSVTSIDEDTFQWEYSFTVKVKVGSYAEEFMKSHHRTCETY